VGSNPAAPTNMDWTTIADVNALRSRMQRGGASMSEQAMAAAARQTTRSFVLSRHSLCKLLGYATGFWVAVLLLQPQWLLGTFFWGNSSAHGIDYWCIPRGFLNLLAGQSMFDTFAGVQFGGPPVTWYLGHPVFVLLVAPWFAFFRPELSLWLWSVATIALLLCVGWMFSRRASSELGKSACIFFSVFGFPALNLLSSGNMHGWLVLALALTVVGLFDLSGGVRSGQRELAAGLLISLFSKPILLFALPMFLLVRQTRKATAIVVAVYVLVSLLCVLVPPLNPASVGLQREIALFFDPAYVRGHMNVYNNHFVLTAEMKDNAIHWLNLVAQSDFYWDHIQIFSLSAFLNSLVGVQLPAMLYKLPLLAALLASFCVPLVRDETARMRAAMWATVLLLLTFFLSYNTVWEYQYTAIIPVLLLGIVLLDHGIDAGNARWLVVSGAVISLPSLYFLFGEKITIGEFAWMRSTRVLPICVLYIVVASTLWRRYLWPSLKRSRQVS